MSHWSPSPGWVVVRRPETEEKIGSIVITPTSQAQLIGWTYEIISSGGPMEPTKHPITGKTPPRGTPHDLQPGDWILTPPRQAVEVDEEGLLILPESSVWAVIQ